MHPSVLEEDLRAAREAHSLAGIPAAVAEARGSTVPSAIQDPFLPDATDFVQIAWDDDGCRDGLWPDGANNTNLCVRRRSCRFPMSSLSERGPPRAGGWVCLFRCRPPSADRRGSLRP